MIRKTIIAAGVAATLTLGLTAASCSGSSPASAPSSAASSPAPVAVAKDRTPFLTVGGPPVTITTGSTCDCTTPDMVTYQLNSWHLSGNGVVTVSMTVTNDTDNSVNSFVGLPPDWVTANAVDQLNNDPSSNNGGDISDVLMQGHQIITGSLTFTGIPFSEDQPSTPGFLVMSISDGLFSGGQNLLLNGSPGNTETNVQFTLVNPAIHTPSFNFCTLAETSYCRNTTSTTGTHPSSATPSPAATATTPPSKGLQDAGNLTCQNQTDGVTVTNVGSCAYVQEETDTPDQGKFGWTPIPTPSAAQLGPHNCTFVNGGGTSGVYDPRLSGEGSGDCENLQTNGQKVTFGG